MEVWILTFILTLSNSGTNSAPVAVMYSEEYNSREACEDSRNNFLSLQVKPDSYIRENKQAYCSKK